MHLSEQYGPLLPFNDLLGIERVQNHEGRAVLALGVKAEFRNSWRAAHGGVIMTLIDCAMSLAARLHLHNTMSGILTIEMNTKFISPGMGDRLIAEGKVIGGGRSMMFCEAEVRDEAGNLLAKGTGTLKPLKKKDT